MKIYDCPEGVDFPGHDYSSFNMDRENEKIDAHKEALRAWLAQSGYNGEHSGKTVRFPVADGYAQYMVGQAPRSMFLIHLPYFDAYDYPYIERLTKADIIQAIKKEENIREFFSRADQRPRSRG